MKEFRRLRFRCSRPLITACSLAAALLFPALGAQADSDWTLTGLPKHTEQHTYDHSTSRVSANEAIFRVGYGSYVLHCHGSGLDGEGTRFSFDLRGLGSPIEVDGRIYVLSAGHVFDVPTALATRGVSLAASTIGPPEYFFEVQGRRVELERLDDGNLDLALFAPRRREAAFPTGAYHCGDSEDLSPGAAVLCWGMPLLEGFELSTGIVSAVAAPHSLIQASFPEAAPEDFFVTSMPTIFGCSGALVYAFRNGSPEIVGMLVAGYLNIGRSVVYKINSILRDTTAFR